MRWCCQERAFWGLVVLACALGACSADCPNFVTIDEVPDDHKLTNGNMNSLQSPHPVHTQNNTQRTNTSPHLPLLHPFLSTLPTALMPGTYVMRLVRPPTVPYRYTELYLGLHSATEHPALAMTIVTQKAVAGNTSAWGHGCPVVSYVGAGALTTEGAFTTCATRNKIVPSTDFRYDKITLPKPLGLPPPSHTHVHRALCTHAPRGEGRPACSGVRRGDLCRGRGDGHRDGREHRLSAARDRDHRLLAVLHDRRPRRGGAVPRRPCRDRPRRRTCKLFVMTSH